MFKRASVFLLLASLIIRPAASMAPPATTPAATANQAVNINPDLVADNATALSQLLFSREIVQSQVGAVLDENLPKSMKSNADFALYEKEYPGLINTITSSIKPVMLKAYDAKLPLLWFNMAKLFRDNFTTVEISQLHGFYTSPAGMRLIASIRRNTNLDNLLKTAMANGEVNEKVTAAARADTNAAIRKSNAQLSPADKLAIFRFENSPVGRKLALFNPKMQKMQLDWDFYFTDTQLSEITQAQSDAITDFITKADAVKTAAPAVPVPAT